MRYALYFTPTSSDALTKVASNWLGRNAFSNERIRRPLNPLMDDEQIQALTHDARRYGFHATLKAPFRLNENKQEDDLIEDLIKFSSQNAAFTLPRLKIQQIGPFFALVPAQKNDELNDLADEVVRFFDPYRAELSEADLLKRKPETLTAKQRDYLSQWGYPYVFDEFRFHMTLTGPVSEEKQEKIRRCLEDFFAPVLNESVEVANLALFTEEESGAPFEVHSLYPLAKTYKSHKRAGQQ